MIEQLIQRVVGRMIKVINFEAEVKSVDDAKDTCVVMAVDGPEIPDVKLKSILSDQESKFVVYPKVGSFVTVSILQNMETECYVSQYSEIQKIVLNTDEVIINGGAKGGLVNWPDVQAELDKNNEILQAILQVITGAPITEPGNGAPSALQQSLGSALNGKTVGNFADKEDTKVKH